jgi:hypothetical protein
MDQNWGRCGSSWRFRGQKVHSQYDFSHSMSMAEQKWTKIGDVVGAAGGSEVREYNPR